MAKNIDLGKTMIEDGLTQQKFDLIKYGATMLDKRDPAAKMINDGVAQNSWDIVSYGYKLLTGKTIEVAKTQEPVAPVQNPTKADLRELAKVFKPQRGKFHKIPGENRFSDENMDTSIDGKPLDNYADEALTERQRAAMMKRSRVSRQTYSLECTKCENRKNVTAAELEFYSVEGNEFVCVDCLPAKGK